MIEDGARSILGSSQLELQYREICRIARTRQQRFQAFGRAFTFERIIDCDPQDLCE